MSSKRTTKRKERRKIQQEVTPEVPRPEYVLREDDTDHPRFPCNTYIAARPATPDPPKSSSSDDEESSEDDDESPVSPCSKHSDEDPGDGNGSAHPMAVRVNSTDSSEDSASLKGEDITLCDDDARVDVPSDIRGAANDPNSDFVLLDISNNVLADDDRHPSKKKTSKNVAEPSKRKTSENVVEPSKRKTSENVAEPRKRTTSENVAEPRKRKTSENVAEPRKKKTSENVAGPSKKKTSKNVSE